MIIPDHIHQIVVEGNTYHAGDELPDDILDRHPDLKDPTHPLNATVIKKEA